MADFFNSVTQSVQHWFSGLAAHFLPNRAPDGNPLPGPLSIEQFRQAATTPGRNQDWMMGSLREQGVNPYDFGKFCSAFADGADYIYQKYGTAPAGIVVTDMPPHQTTYYNFPSQTIFVSRQWIGESMDRYMSIQDKTEPYALLTLQAATMYGVEEAFHHYQFTQHGDYYVPLMESYKTPAQDLTAYQAHPFEADAKIEVQAALKDFGYTKMPIAPYYEQQWQQKIAESRAQGQQQAESGTAVARA